MLILEDGSGVRGANSYVNESYVTNYLALRAKETDFVSATSSEKLAAMLEATAYVESRFGKLFLGVSEISFEEIKATATITVDAIPSPGDSVVYGDVSVSFGSNVAIGPTVEECADSLSAALSGTVQGATVTVRAPAPGAGGNLVELTVDASMTATPFAGGADEGPHTLSFPRTGFSGVPDQIRQAVSEYVTRAIEAPLSPDPVNDASGGAVIETEEAVGPIVERRVYESGTFGRFRFKSYPTADRLILPFTYSAGRVIRG